MITSRDIIQLFFSKFYFILTLLFFRTDYLKNNINKIVKFVKRKNLKVNAILKQRFEEFEKEAKVMKPIKKNRKLPVKHKFIKNH